MTQTLHTRLRVDLRHDCNDCTGGCSLVSLNTESHVLRHVTCCATDHAGADGWQTLHTRLPGLATTAGIMIAPRVRVVSLNTLTCSAARLRNVIDSNLRLLV